jgi:plastocyanin
VRKLIVIALVGSAAAVAVPAESASALTIRLGDHGYSRSSASVAPRTLVTFRIRGHKRHQVRKLHGPGGRIRSRATKRGTFRVRLRRRGTYHFVCGRHGLREQLYIRVR